MIFKIKDWAGNVCYQGKEFQSFDDAEEFLCETLSGAYDSDRCEYEITFDRYEILDEENYFDQAEAAYTVCVLWHGGQDSLLYSLQSRIDFKPGHAWSESHVESENEFFSTFEAYAENDEHHMLEKFVDELDHYFGNREE